MENSTGWIIEDIYMQDGKAVIVVEHKRSEEVRTLRMSAGLVAAMVAKDISGG